MTRTFIQTDEFIKNWERLGVIQGTGKLRKMRFAFENKGKSGSSRVCYVDFLIHETVYLITVYSKNEKDNLSKAERNEIKKFIDILEKRLGGNDNE